MKGGPKSSLRPFLHLALQLILLKSIKMKIPSKLTNHPHCFLSQIICKNSQNICESISTIVLCHYDSNLHFSKLQPRYQQLKI